MDMGVSENGGTPKSSHFSNKPSILGYRYFWKHPYDEHIISCRSLCYFQLENITPGPWKLGQATGFQPADFRGLVNFQKNIIFPISSWRYLHFVEKKSPLKKDRYRNWKLLIRILGYPRDSSTESWDVRHIDWVRVGFGETFFYVKTTWWFHSIFFWHVFFCSRNFGESWPIFSASVETTT